MFTKDERAVVEPNSDLVVMVLAVIGFVIFISVISQTYQIYQEKTLIAQHYDDALSLAELLGNDPLLTVSRRPELIDASRIESMDAEDINELKSKYAAGYNFSFKIEVPPTYSKVVGTSEELGISASVPVTIRLNDVEEMPGTLTVKIWEK